MNKKAAERVRTMPDTEIQDELDKLREEFFLRRFTSDPKRISNPGKFRDVRRTIARLLTEQNVRRRAAANAD